MVRSNHTFKAHMYREPRPVASKRSTACFKHLQLQDCYRLDMLQPALLKMPISHTAVRAVTVVSSIARAPHMQLRCVLVSLDPASASPAKPLRSTTGRWMHDASAFAVTPETKLHRPTDLEEEGLGLVDWIARPSPSPPPLFPGWRDVHSGVE